MTEILRYLGRDSPWPQAVAAIAFVLSCVAVTMLMVAIVAPPVIFVLRHVFGWWWRLWL
jgi:hypothetical protein